MNNERLEQLEALANKEAITLPDIKTAMFAIPELIAEVRRLREKIAFYEMDLPEFEEGQRALMASDWVLEGDDAPEIIADVQRCARDALKGE